MTASNLPVVQRARLPVNYEAARQALSECSRIDECKDWSDKAEALASYARQAEDETLLRLAIRIKDRAIRRAGMLIEQIPKSRGGRPKLGEAPPLVSRKEAIADAGLSPDQAKTAVRLARVPEAEFERLVESDDPPPPSRLAPLGKIKRPEVAHQEQSNPAFPTATKALGTLRRFAEFCEENDPEVVASAVMRHEVEPTRRRVGVIDQWLDLFVTRIGGVIDVRPE